MVVTQERVAAEVGAAMLARGGNAVDAAVATGFALAVTFPQAGNLGGGGFMLIYLAEEQSVVALDYREMAPGYAHPDLFLDDRGEVDPNLSRNGIYASGIPGTVAGLVQAQQQFGKLELAEVLQPAIALARDGIEVSGALAYALERAGNRLRRNPAAADYFFKPDGSLYAPGDIWIQADLAGVLASIAERGRDGFYRGSVAELLKAEWRRQGATLTQEDLDRYEVIEREPVWGSYGGYQLASMPPPSSGGVHLLQMLNVLSHFDLAPMEHNSARYLHLLMETMKFAYADRSRYLGDPDFSPVPVQELLDADYAERIAAQIDLNRATPSAAIAPGLNLMNESMETTHFSVWDGEGNVVSNTYTLNFSFGSGIAVEGAGFLLNNEMDDFAAAPGRLNAFGLIGGTANQVEAYKRPLSSMAPTLVFRDGQPVLATGSPGGSAIITIVLQVLLNLIDFDMNVAEAVAAPRIHHQWLPDSFRWEPGISADTRQRLLEMGQHPEAGPSVWGKAESIMADGDWLYGAMDPRWPDSGAESLPPAQPSVGGN